MAIFLARSEGRSISHFHLQSGFQRWHRSCDENQLVRIAFPRVKSAASTCVFSASVSVGFPSSHPFKSRLRRQSDGVGVLAHAPRHLPTGALFPIPYFLLIHILGKDSGRPQILCVDARFAGIVPLSFARSSADVNFFGFASRSRIRRLSAHHMTLALTQNSRG